MEWVSKCPERHGDLFYRKHLRTNVTIPKTKNNEAHNNTVKLQRNMSVKINIFG